MDGAHEMRPRSRCTLPTSHIAASTETRQQLGNERLPWLPRHRSSFQFSRLLIFLIVTTCCLSLTSATLYGDFALEIEEQMVEGDARPQPSRLPAKLLVDLSPPPVRNPQNPKAWILSTEFDDLKRQEKRAEDAAKATQTSMTTSVAPAKQTSSSGGISVAASEATVALPTPFDQGLNNITESCSAFMNGFLSNATFKACLPLSMLLQNSIGFFQAAKSITLMTQTLDATCAANVDDCAPLMASLATNITAASNCASDLSAKNPLIQQAQLGLSSYHTLYTATCQRNPTTSSYCFADAVTNVSSPTDSYIYYLPLNISLPGGSQPTCNSCLQSGMGVFANATSDRTTALAGDYVLAAQQINILCGPNFVSQSLAAAVTNAGVSGTAAPISSIGMLALAILVGSWLF